MEIYPHCEVDQVQVGERLRSLDANKVAELAKNMDAIGLQHPISIYSPNNEVLELGASPWLRIQIPYCRRTPKPGFKPER